MKGTQETHGGILLKVVVSFGPGSLMTEKRRSGVSIIADSRNSFVDIFWFDLRVLGIL